MKKLLFVLFVLITGVASGQGVRNIKRIKIGENYFMVQDLTPISGYTRIFARYEWNSGAFDSTLYAPRYNGVPTGARVNENSDIDGKLAVDTANHRLYFYSGGSWRYSTAGTSGGTPTWQQTLTAGSTLTIDNNALLNGNNFSFTAASSRLDSLRSIGANIYVQNGIITQELNDSYSGAGSGTYTHSNDGRVTTNRHYGEYTSGCTTCGLNTMETRWLQNAAYPGGTDTLLNAMGAHNGPNDKHFYLADLTDDYSAPGIPANRYVTIEKNGTPFFGAYNNPSNNNSQILIGFYPAWATSGYEAYRFVVGGRSIFNGRVNLLDSFYATGLTNLSTQDRIIGQYSSDGRIGYATLGSGLSLSSGVLNTSGTVATPISSLTAATGTNSIDNGTRVQQWNWNTLANNSGLVLNSTSTTAAGNAQTLLYISSDGTNATSSQTTYGQQINNAHDGTSSTNVGIKVAATNGTNNYAIIVPASSGDVGIGTSAPTSKLHVVSTQTTGVGNQFSSSTTTTGTILDITGTSTALAAGNEGLNIGISGANGTNGITATGARISVTNTNATSGTNVGLDLTASGATTANNALNIAAGAIALNGSAGTSGQVLTSAGANTLPTWSTPSSGLTVGTTTITSGTTQRLLYDNAGVLGEISVGSSGAFLRSNGTSYGASTLILPNAATSGYIPYATASNTWGESSDFVHTSTEIQNTQSASSQIGFRAKNTSTASGNVNASLFVENSSSYGQLYKAGTNYTTYKNIAASDLGFYNNTSGNISILNDAANINFAANGSSTANMVITSTVITMGIYGAGAATFDASGNISSVSDVRLKNVQGYYNSGLAAIGKIHPIVYKWNEKSHMETEHSYIGFSAQNILSALGNDAIGVNPDGYLSIQDRAIMATLVNAVQEQQKMINDLIKEVKKLKRK